ncbi:hypothetical protein BWI17_05275 [Betaproteobacteria bacterium GR16-43]|nr:hypothetical protein BWI17_05275 [Betaproteobacteria bacterium GR16-43]
MSLDHFVRAGIAMFALVASIGTFSDAHAQGMTVYNNSCSTNGTGCHAFPPGGAILNAANSAAVITTANTQHGMGFSAGFMVANAGNIATYIGTLITGSQTVNVNYGATVGFAVNDIVLNDGGAGVVTTINQVSAPARGNMLGSGTASVSYQHTATNCTSDTFQVRGSGLANTSNRTINITVNAPSAPVAANGATTIAYNTGAQTINLAALGMLSGTAPAVGTTPGLGTPSPNVGTVSGTGPATFTYSANATTYAPTVTVAYNVTGPCGATSATRTVTVSVNAPPPPVVANVGPITVPGGANTPIDLTAFITGVTASNPAGTYALTASQPGVAGSGTTSVAGNVVTYVPSGTFAGTTTFTYTKDGPGGTSNTGTVTLNVSAVPPVVFSGPSATGTGTITASFIGGGGACVYSAPQFIGVPPGAPPIPPTAPPGKVVFPHGLFDFSATGCIAGSTLTFTIVYPQSLPPETQYWKYGPTAADPTAHWYVLPAALTSNTATFSITDGGLGDDDLAANGTIVDQGGPGAGALRQVPALDRWGTILLALGLLLCAYAVLHRRRA